MKIVLLTRTNRPSGENILKSLVQERKNVVGVVAEKRTSLLFKPGIFSFFKNSLKKHGCAFLCQRTMEFLKSLFTKKMDFLVELCRRNKTPFFLVNDHNDPSTKQVISSLNPDVLITANTRIIKDHILKIPNKAAINFHSSKLPQYAGLDSIFWALYHGEKEIGVTIHYLEPGIDTGDIILQKTFPVEQHDDLNSLTSKANNLAGKIIVKVLEKFERDDYRATPQVASNRSYFSWPTPAQRKELKRRLKTLKA